MSEVIKIGSRDSRLAVVQAESVIDALKCAGRETSLVTMKTTGDKILNRTLDQVGGKGLFVKELDAALRERRADFTVHSLKDMPVELPDDLPLAAVSVREDARDVLVLRRGLKALPENPVLGCSSARRRVQLRRLIPEADIRPVRGNIQTRLQKLDEGQFDALILAAAGLHRLGLEERISRYFSPEEILPAAGQGIIAVQSRSGADTACFEGYHDEDVWRCALAERAFVRALDGGCSSPVAAYAVIENGMLRLWGMYVKEDNEAALESGEKSDEPKDSPGNGEDRGEFKEELRFGEITGTPENGEALGAALAARLREGAEI